MARYGRRQPFRPILGVQTGSQISGAGSCTFTFDVAGVGSSQFSGAGASTFTFNVSGVGVTAVLGSGSSTFTFDNAGVGASLFSGAGASTFTFTTDGVGKALFSGAGASTVTFTTDGVGKSLFSGAGAASFMLSAAGAATALISGSGASSFSFAAAAVGLAAILGAGSATLTFDVAGVGSSVFTGTPTLVFKDRVQETSITTGTGAYALAGAVVSFQPFSVILDGHYCYYMATNGTDWEVGLGTYSTSGNSLDRTFIYASSNSGNAVSWAAGTKNIDLVHPATSIRYPSVCRTVPAGETLRIFDTYSLVVASYFDVAGTLVLDGDAVMDVI